MKNISQHPINQSHPTHDPDHMTLYPTQPSPHLQQKVPFHNSTTVRHYVIIVTRAPYQIYIAPTLFHIASGQPI